MNASCTSSFRVLNLFFSVPLLTSMSSLTKTCQVWLCEIIFSLRFFRCWLFCFSRNCGKKKIKKSVLGFKAEFIFYTLKSAITGLLVSASCHMSNGLTVGFLHLVFLWKDQVPFQQLLWWPLAAVRVKLNESL